MGRRWLGANIISSTHINKRARLPVGSTKCNAKSPGPQLAKRAYIRPVVRFGQHTRVDLPDEEGTPRNSATVPAAVSSCSLARATATAAPGRREGARAWGASQKTCRATIPPSAPGTRRQGSAAVALGVGAYGNRSFTSGPQRCHLILPLRAIGCTLLGIGIGVLAKAQTSDTAALALDSVYVTVARAKRPSPPPLATHRAAVATLAFTPGVNVRPAGAAGVGGITYQGLSGARLTQRWQGIEVNNPQLGAGDTDELALGLLGSVRFVRADARDLVTLDTRQQPSSTPYLGVALQSGAGYSLTGGLRGLRAVARLDRLRNAHVPELRPGSARHEQFGMSLSDSVGAHFTHDSYALSQTRELPIAGQGEAPSTVLRTRVLRHLWHWRAGERLTVRAGGLYDGLAYTDIAERSSRGRTWQALLASQHAIAPWLQASSEVRYVDSRHDEYADNLRALRHESSLSAAITAGSVTLDVSAGLLGQTGLAAGPFASLRAVTDLGTRARASLRLSSDYRLPNYDDRLWAQGGRADILPERTHALSLETGLRRGAWNFAAEAYGRIIDDYTLWLPGVPLWRPRNVSRVVNYGGQASAAFAKTFHTSELRLRFATDYTVIRPVEAAADELVVAQLPFTPRLGGLANAVYSRGPWSVRADLRVVGRQATAFGDAVMAAAYVLADGHLAYTRHRFAFMASVTNLFDQNIASALLVPTPLRRFALSANLTFPTKPQT